MISTPGSGFDRPALVFFTRHESKDVISADPDVTNCIIWIVSPRRRRRD